MSQLDRKDFLEAHHHGRQHGMFCASVRRRGSGTLGTPAAPAAARAAQRRAERRRADGDGRDATGGTATGGTRDGRLGWDSGDGRFGWLARRAAAGSGAGGPAGGGAGRSRWCAGWSWWRGGAPGGSAAARQLGAAGAGGQGMGGRRAGGAAGAAAVAAGCACRTPVTAMQNAGEITTSHVMTMSAWPQQINAGACRSCSPSAWRSIDSPAYRHDHGCRVHDPAKRRMAVHDDVSRRTTTHTHTYTIECMA